MLIEDVEQVGFDAFTFQNLHAVLSQNLMREEGACGRIRRRPVEISGTVFHPLAMPQVLQDCFPLKIRYREALIQAVQFVVKGLRTPSPEIITELAGQYAAAAEQDAFVQMLGAALKQLHEGSVVRYRLRRSEFLEWQPLRGAAEMY